MSFSFDGYNKLIIVNSTESFDIAFMYSRWKDWVTDGYAQFHPAFRTLGGDAISATQTIAPYFFLNTTEGWKIRPAEIDHELRVVGNLYAENPLDSLFAPTVGEYTVTAVIERSSAAIGVTGLTDEQAAYILALYENIPLQTIFSLRQ